MANVYTRGQAVVIQRKAASLLGIVQWVDVVPEGKPGPNRYRYAVQPARLVDGKPQPIAAALAFPHMRGRVLQAYDPSIHINPWKF